MRNDTLSGEIEIIQNVLGEKKANHIGLDDFHIGILVEIPNHSGCFKKADTWYIYEIDEQKHITFCGPFSLYGAIYACAMKLHISEYVNEYKFSEDELAIYLHKHFHSFDEL